MKVGSTGGVSMVRMVWSKHQGVIWMGECNHFNNARIKKCDRAFTFMRLFKLFIDQIPVPMKGAFSPALKLICHTQATLGKSSLCAGLIK